VIVHPLEEANCCGFAFEKTGNKSYVVVLEAIPLRNTIWADILLILEFLKPCAGGPSSSPEKENEARLLVTGCEDKNH
jgi:hypothetical protein